MGSRKAILYLDVLNVLACICVVGMHCNGIVHNFDGSSAWVQSMVVETLAYWAVPVFFMLSGATMMNYRERYSTGEFFKRRILRVGIPFIFWTLFMAAVKYGNGEGHRMDRFSRFCTKAVKYADRKCLLVFRAVIYGVFEHACIVQAGRV